MTAQSKKTEQKRLDCCVLGQPKWTKIHETLKKCAAKPSKRHLASLVQPSALKMDAKSINILRK